MGEGTRGASHLIFWLFRRPDAQHCCRKDDARRDGHNDWHGIPSWHELGENPGRAARLPAAADGRT